MKLNKLMRWLLGLIILIGVNWVILFYPNNSILEWQSPLLKYSFLILFVCGMFCLYRIFKGPTAADRAVALDILGILVVGFCVILGVVTKRSWYIDIAIAWALQSFIGTLALAKYLEGKNFDE
ncbi:MAG: cation:proton antiporter [Candidatus Omnitrophica bacterium]|nr:cation:proton antiporter [Candidatus Omnitrophota bacterium]MDD5352499.1 cation:proton antiporter [Candidatus Omnitrophota bacterium]MDD5550097.1 cation:proton antiporter [Candidatus Omnitrophota bacterium]